MIDYSKLKDALYDWASTQAGETPVIWANQNAPAPAGTFITLLINPVINIGQDYQTPPEEVFGMARIIGNREFTLSIQGFGSGSFQILSDIRFSLNKWTVQHALRLEGIAIIEKLGLNDISELFDTEIEERVSLDVRFRIASPFIEDLTTADDEVGVIETVEYEGDLSGHIAIGSVG